MGQHTWFYKNKDLYDKKSALYKQLVKHEDGEIYLDELEIIQLRNQIEEISDKNDADYHDLFRTGKRNPDGTYTDDVIYSEKECMQWIKDNNIEITEISIERLKEFWNEYSDGVIDFG